MKTLRSKTDIDLAIELSHVIAERRTLEKRETELKDYFKNKINDFGVIRVGDVIIVLSECERESLDRKALETELGVDRVKEFVNITTYTKLEVKGA